MKNILPSKFQKRMNESALLNKTGKSMEEWFLFMDRFTSLGLNEKELSRLIHENFKLNAWWQNAIISAYNLQRKSRQTGEPAEEIKITHSLELQVPLSVLYNLWSDLKLRNSWFPMGSYTIVREVPRKLVHLLWHDSISILIISFLKIDKTKSQIQIIHTHIPDKKNSQELDAYWKRVLETLNESVNSDIFHTLILDI